MSRPSHMHTVPAGYLRAFADKSGARRNPHVWRFERETSDGKLISIRNASVYRDIYALRGDDGTADTTIETDLLGATVEESFPSVVALLSEGKEVGYWQWRDISRFMAFQLARTPRMFQVLRDEWSRNSNEAGLNDPQLAMVYIAPFYEKWLCGMTWVVCWNTSELPFMTSDNPVVTWVDRGDGTEIGVGFEDSSLQVLFPLAPKLSLNAVQTPNSAALVRYDTADDIPRFSDRYALHIGRRRLSMKQVVKLNQVTVSNAERYAYVDRNQANVRRFLKDVFLGRTGPVRRSDKKPIGSEIGPETPAPC